MFSKVFLCGAFLPIATQAINIISSNDDGWAEKNIRVFYDQLTAAGYSVVVSAPAENQSGTGSSTGTPTVVTDGCEFDSCPAGSPAEGYNSSDTHLNYVNSYPVTAIDYGISTLSPKFFGGDPDLAVAGPNVGGNTGVETYFSGTVGAATAAVSTYSVPAIAFSGTTGDQIAWNVTTPLYSTVYADLAVNLTTTLLNSGTPYLPNNTWLNVNFPDVSDTECSSTSDFHFVLSRIYTAVPLVSGVDVVTCDNGGRLPTETTVVGTSGCYVAVSVGKANNKRDQVADVQEVVLDKLSSILECLPSS